VVLHQLIRLRSVKNLLKVNYGLDHGGYAFASKFGIQAYVGHEHFPATILLDPIVGRQAMESRLISFGKQYGYPIVLKPDSGYVGKGIFKIDNASAITGVVPNLTSGYLAQAFVPGDIEFGLFYVRGKDGVSIPSINQKYYPSVIGDGKSSIIELAIKDSCYNDNWQTFLKDVDLREVLPTGKKRTLSFIGSNTLGSRFTDVSDLVTPELVASLERIFANAQGVNFSRLDVKATSIESFQGGEFEIIEVNGLASQPTCMLDQRHRVRDIFRILNTHALLLVRTAHLHRKEKMYIMNWIPFLKETRKLMVTVERQHTLTQRIRE
jgi:hypothetical protein